MWPQRPQSAGPGIVGWLARWPMPSLRHHLWNSITASKTIVPYASWGQQPTSVTKARSPWRSRGPGDLYADFAAVDLCGADLTWTELTGVDLSGGPARSDDVARRVPPPTKCLVTLGQRRAGQARAPQLLPIQLLRPMRL